MKKIFLIILFVVASCQKENSRKANIQWDKARNYYIKNLSDAIDFIAQIEKNGNNNKLNKELFKKLRSSFKVAEPYASYLNPEVGHRANGPALPIFKEDNGKVIKPVGLQKIEESIYDGGVEDKEFNKEVYVTKGLLNVLLKDIQKRPLNPQRFFIAVHQQLLRIISHSITGFDTPVSHLGIQEAAVSLQSLLEVYKLTLKNQILITNKELDLKFTKAIDSAVQFLIKNNDFDNFDRFTFIRDYFNEITRTWLTIRKETNLWTPVDYLPFNFDAPTFFEKNSFLTKHFLTGINKNVTQDQVLLGKKLFFEPKLSKNGNMSCATCHIPSKAYTDGLKVAIDNKGKNQLRNTPTLVNSVYQKAFFWDGRSATLFDQISSVFLNKKEFNSNVHQFSTDILSDSTYSTEFKKAYGVIPKKNTEVIKAITAYISNLKGFNSKFDKNVISEENSYSNLEKLGANLFMGKALCATCHFMPLTNGTVPPFFAESEKEVIGVPKTSENKLLDTDLGFYWMFQQDLHKGMFKTPTVRNSELTAPYMHNGAYATLTQVVDFYNKGGGAGLGFSLPHQTLPFDNLKLTDKEQEALVAFMKTLTDVNVDSY